MKNVLLVGIGGVYNYGCEAIVRGTVNILKQVDSTIKVAYASYNYVDDVKRLSDCDVEILERPRRKRWTLRNIMRKCLSYAGISYMLPYDATVWVDRFDTVFSIGGDIYTLSSNGAYSASLPLFLRACQKKGLKYVLWGASVGKFEKNSKALRFFRGHLPQVDLIVAREKNTINYLIQLGVCDNVCLAPDPAFFVTAFQKQVAHEGIRVGINLSPLSALYEYGSMDLAAKKQITAVCNLMEQMQCEVLFLPHVLSPVSYDNDLAYMQSIRADMPSQYRDKTRMVDTDPGFIGLKQYIAQCDYVIAARMHCAINAITTSVPTLFLSYSEKAKGMSEFVYGSEDSVLSLKDFEETPLVVSRLKNCRFDCRKEEIKKFDFKTLFDKE